MRVKRPVDEEPEQELAAEEVKRIKDAIDTEENCLRRYKWMVGSFDASGHPLDIRGNPVTADTPKNMQSGRGLSSKELSIVAASIRQIIDARVKRLKTLGQKKMEAALEIGDADELVVGYLSKIPDEQREEINRAVDERRGKVASFPVQANA